MVAGQGDMGGFGQQAGLMDGAAPPAAAPGVNPKVAAMQKEMRERLALQEETEQKTKAELNAKAKTYLSSFYEVLHQLLVSHGTRMPCCSSTAL